MRDPRRSNNSLFADHTPRRRELRLRRCAMSLRLGQRPCVDRQPEEESESGVHCCRRFHLAWPAWRNCDRNEASSSRAKGAEGSFDFPIVRSKQLICALCTRSSHRIARDIPHEGRRIDLRPARLDRFAGRACWEDQGASIAAVPPASSGVEDQGAAPISFHR